MTDDPRHFALQAALRRMRVHLEQAVADNDAAIAAWDAIDDRRIDDATVTPQNDAVLATPVGIKGCPVCGGPWVEVTHFEDAEHQWQNTETGERWRWSLISAKPGDAGAPDATRDVAGWLDPNLTHKVRFHEPFCECSPLLRARVHQPENVVYSEAAS